MGVLIGLAMIVLSELIGATLLAVLIVLGLDMSHPTVHMFIVTCVVLGIVGLWTALLSGVWYAYTK